MLISSTERIELKIYIILFGIIVCTMGIALVTWDLLVLGLVLIAVSFLLFYYAYNLCKVEVIGDKLRITRNKLTIETQITNIKKLSYRFFMWNLVTEPHIKIRFKAKTKFGKSIIFSPSNLTEDNEFKFNRKIKKLLEHKIEEYENTRVTKN